MPSRDESPNIPATPPAKTLNEVRLKLRDFVLCITFLEFIGITGGDTIMYSSEIINYIITFFRYELIGFDRCSMNKLRK